MKNIGDKYECYSKKVFGFLTMKGFRYKYKFIHRNTKKTAWVYIMSEELSQSLIDYKKLNN